MVRELKPVVVHISNWHTNWILEGIFRESAAACALRPTWQIHATSRRDYLRPKVIRGKLNPQVGELNIFTHQQTFFSVIAHNPELIRKTRNRVYFTHFNIGQTLDESQISSLNFCERILVQNKSMQEFLIGFGVSKEIIVRAPGAVNRDFYTCADSFPGKVFVLFSGNFKYRKNPELIARVIAKMSDIDFIIHGLNWDSFPDRILDDLTNIKKINFDLSIQPELMRQASLYVSLSLAEGGPYTVFEALASGTPVVATNTGFCEEFINEANGILLPNPPDLDTVEKSIRLALSMKRNVWNQDLLYGKWQWEDLGRLIYE